MELVSLLTFMRSHEFFGEQWCISDMTSTKNGKEVSVDIVRAFNMGRHNTLYVTISKDARRTLNVQRGDKFLLKIDSEGRLVYEPIREHATQRGMVLER
jgi:uncharacterized protein YqjF (DUF2071 family)